MWNFNKRKHTFGFMAPSCRRQQRELECMMLGIDPSALDGPKSKRAQQAEDEAKAKFDELRAAVEAKPPAGKKMYDLLNPTQHLTAVCNKSFRRHVSRCSGWTANRRQATPEEKKYGVRSCICLLHKMM